MKTNPREILVYYNHDSVSDRKTVAYAKSVSKHVKTYRHSDANMTPTLWKGLIKKLGIEPKKLFNKALPQYKSQLKGKEFGSQDMLNVIIRNPHLLRAPIAVSGRQAILCESPTDILRLQSA